MQLPKIISSTGFQQCYEELGLKKTVSVVLLKLIIISTRKVHVLIV
jgi:hypothetical protein